MPSESMPSESAGSTGVDPPRPSAEPGDGSRMSFGDHLDELRGCLIRGLLGTALLTVLSLVYGTEILRIICRPLLEVQAANGLQPSLQALAPVAPFAAYLKIGFLGGLILSAPWLLYQIWRFVAIGLYANERRFFRWLIGPSTLLFFLGVVFMYFVVLPMVLQFFIGFNQRLGTSDLFQVAAAPHVASKPPASEGGDTSTAPLPTFPLLSEDPESPKPGAAWVNAATHRLMIQTDNGIWSAPLDPAPTSSLMRSQFAIDFYITFVMTLSLAFGIAFETPIVVFFLAWTGLVTTDQMARGRRYVLLVAVGLAAVLTPPDVISQLLLAGPMYFLFELGLFAARTVKRKAGTSR